MKKILAGVWLLACGAVLFVTLYSYDAKIDKDIGPLFVWLMIFLTFPTGLLVASAIALLVMAGFEVPAWISPIAFYVCMWFVFVMAGYTQWFRSLPWLWRKIRQSLTPLDGGPRKSDDAPSA